jgi:glycosyltransferase involved in cell wall biosynthesis
LAKTDTNDQTSPADVILRDLSTRPTVCFFAKVGDPQEIETIEFYAQDVSFLKDLGYRVRIATRLRDLFDHPVDDLYFCWWWTWAFFPVAIAKSFRKPAIVTGTFNHHLYRGRPLHQRKLIAWAARRASANVFVSQLERDAVTRLIPDTRLPTVSPHTVDTADYIPNAARDFLRDPNLLLSVVHLDGGNSIRKCVAESIRALARLAQTRPDIRLIIAGERGSDYPGLAGLADELGVRERVVFPGRVTREEKIRLMQRCAIYLQLSTFEGFGLAGLEAMACGAPVVTSPVGAVPEVGGDAVVYVNGQAPDAIAVAVDELLGADERRIELGRSARRRAVQEFPLERRRHDLAEVLRAIGAPC